MQPKLVQFSKEISRIITEAGIRMGTKKAMQLEAAMMAGYIYGAQSENPEAHNDYLHLLIMGGRQLTTEVQQS